MPIRRYAGPDRSPVTGRRPPDSKTGTFQSGAGGDYVFFVKDGNRFGEIALLLNGRQIAGVENMWTPYTLSAKVKLQADTTYALEITGGGPDTKLFGRPLGNTTTFRSTAGDTIDYTFFYGPELDQVIAGYRLATGAAPLWPNGPMASGSAGNATRASRKCSTRRPSFAAGKSPSI